MIMSKLMTMSEVKRVLNVLAIAIVLGLLLSSPALSAGQVSAVKDAKGWKLQVNGSDYFVKGMVWGYTPIGENHAYGLWSYPDEHIKKVIDRDFRMMKAAGVNTVRSFMGTPPRWIQYIYEQYGIMSIVNPDAGRYGLTINGIWMPNTDYSDPAIRAYIKNDILAVVEAYKNTPGVLMFAIGNENNYGLEWKSGEIENLPEGERHREKAKYLYSLFNEIITAAKQIDSSHPYAIVNGDTQYLDLIKEQCTALDIFASNFYRGRSFTDMWGEVKQKLDLPVVITEFGSDAFNALRYQEDQFAQADILSDQWQEIYHKGYGQGAEGNALGAFVFSWRDGWWKYRIEDAEDLYLHNRNASWSNGGYPFDYLPGKNNMNEEWFGINQLGPLDSDGIAETTPRLAYYMLQDVWKVDPLTATGQEIDQAFAGIDLHAQAAAHNIKVLGEKRTFNEMFYLEGGELKLESVINGVESTSRTDSSEGMKLALDFGFSPTSWLTGNFTLDYVGNAAVKSLEEYYEKERSDNSIHLYDLDATIETEYFDLNAFYHVSRYHWQYKGDFFGLLWEATDLEGMDIWDAAAPYGAEFVGKKGLLEGLTVVGGEEIYWGANPKWIAKYTFGTENFEYTIMHSEDYDRAEKSSNDSSATQREERSTAVSVETTIFPGMTIQAGAIRTNPKKEDDMYDYLDGGRVKQDEIEFEDTLGYKLKVLKDDFDFGHAYFAAGYFGMVADAGEPLREFDTLLPYSRYGNKYTLEAGVGIFRENSMIYPRIFYRDNLEDANPLIEPTIVGTTLFPGIVPRNTEDDPFAVLDNRKALSAEIFYTYDPTPETDFYHWDNEHQENAPIAFNVGFNYTQFDSITDAYRIYDGNLDIEYAFDTGLKKEDVWKIASRVVLNPTKWVRLANRFEAAYQQSTGTPEGPTQEYYSWEFDYDFGLNHNVAGYVKKDAWGPYDYYRQWNVIFPLQVRLDYTYQLERMLNDWFQRKVGKNVQIGITGIYRTLDDEQAEEDDNDHEYQITTFLSYGF